MSVRAQILRLSRLGADAQAWAAFRAAGLEGRRDVDTLILTGRLKKDQAVRAAGSERLRLFREASADYAAAAAHTPSTYALINAASLAQLAGDATAARGFAEQVLALLDSGRHDPDTPYWLAATRAEAELLTGDPAAAQATMAQAIALLPRAWEEHATTLRQFALLLEASGAEAGWLDQFRPAPVLHFDGLIGLAADDAAAARTIAEAVTKLRPSLGIGALAAGSDILIAEALLASDAELHVVLPCDADCFVAQSVAPAGGDWAARFSKLLDDAASVTITSPIATLSDAAIDLAKQVAMGMAIRQARALATRPVALRITDARAATTHGAAEALWRAAGHAIEAVPLVRSAEVHPLADAARDTLTALVAVRDKPVRSYASFGEALRVAKAKGSAAGIDLSLSADDTLALAALNAAPGAIVATSRAAAAALLHDASLEADLIGGVRSPTGEDELWRLRPAVPQAAPATRSVSPRARAGSAPAAPPPRPRVKPSL